MPSIPVYGFDELEPSLLNKAKRRVIGLMDIAEETLTQEPQTDPTNGNQNTEVEVLTDDIYNVVKDIEVLDTFINDTSGVDELRLIDANDPTSLRTFRAEFKKSASQITKVNNALRKINTTYDKIRPNMVYTNLKTYTGLINSVSILKKSALSFFEIIDELIFNIRRAQGSTTYTRPPINRSDEDIVETEEDTSAIPPILSTPSPFPPLPPVPFIPPPPPPPPPPKPPSKRKILSFKVKVSAKAKTAGLDATQTAEVLSLADDFVANNGRVGDATEIDTLIADYLASSAQAPTPLTETFTDMVDRVTANLSPQEQIDVGKGIGLYTYQFQKEPTELEVQDIITQVINPKGSSSSSSSIPVGIPQPTQGVPVGQKQDFNALFSASAQLKPKITKIGVDKLERNENFLRDAISAGDQTAITKYSNKLQKIIDIGNRPYIKISTSGVKKLPSDEKKELTKLENAYRAAKQNLSEKTTQQDELTDFLDEKEIDYTKPA